ncbi:xylulokinase [Frondihabitans sp. PhB161]|nr:xylulokinase [Frondihabitans sp. PhB153]RPF08122.1 xylulokinase [Frondihabitans sp. PhB161]
MVAPEARRAVVCGIDVGTTNCKVVAIDRDGAVVSRVARVTPRSESDLSIDAKALLLVLEGMLIEVCGEEFAIAALAVAGIGEDGVLADTDLDPVGSALAWFDPRRRRLFRDLKAELPSDPDGLGVGTDSSRTIVGWLWATSQPGNDRAATWLALSDYAAAVWSSKPFMSDTLAARTSAWLPGSRTWIEDRVVRTLHDARLLPEVIRTGDIVGPVTSSRLRKAGVLLPEAMVVAGGHDHPIGGWGVSLLHDGAILDSMGTAEVIVAQSTCADFALDGGIDVEPGIRSTGTTLLRVEELSRNIDWASQDPDVSAALVSLISGEVSPDPFFASPTFIAGARGGERPRYARDAPRSALSRASAVLGALARLGDSAIDAVAEVMPAEAAVYAAGGWSRSEGWMRAKQAVSNRQIRVVDEPEVTAVSVALLAGTAIGWPVPAAAALSGTGQQKAI